MQSLTDAASSEKGAHLDAKKIVILCAGNTRSLAFWPSQNILFIHEHDTQRKVELGYSSSRILEILIDRADAIVSRDDIFKFAWPDRIVGQNSLNQAISTIRELLADEEHRSIIQTIPRRGYQFNSEFLLSSGLIPDMGDASHTQAGSVPKRPPAGRFTWPTLVFNLRKALMTVIVLLVAGLLLRIDWGLWRQTGFTQQVETEGPLTVWYTGMDASEVEQLKAHTANVRERMLKMLDAPGTVIFNTMHSFYEIVCISGSTVEFVSVHKSKLSTLTDEQLNRCLK